MRTIRRGGRQEGAEGMQAQPRDLALVRAEGRRDRVPAPRPHSRMQSRIRPAVREMQLPQPRAPFANALPIHRAIRDCSSAAPRHVLPPRSLRPHAHVVVRGPGHLHTRDAQMSNGRPIREMHMRTCTPPRAGSGAAPPRSRPSCAPPSSPPRPASSGRTDAPTCPRRPSRRAPYAFGYAYARIRECISTYPARGARSRHRMPGFPAWCGV